MYRMVVDVTELSGTQRALDGAIAEIRRAFCQVWRDNI